MTCCDKIGIECHMILFISYICKHGNLKIKKIGKFEYRCFVDKIKIHNGERFNPVNNLVY
jgi:hypothetical protein